MSRRSKISWTRVETGSAVTWKYPSCILKGNNSIGEFYSIAVQTISNKQIQELMIHIGKNTKSTIISKVSQLENLRTAIEDSYKFHLLLKMHETSLSVIHY